MMQAHQKGLGGGAYGGEFGRRAQDAVRTGSDGGPGGQRRSDDRIRESVSEELARHPGIDASDIGVRVENGRVTLTGTVEDRRTRRRAERCVEQCSGVTEVRNRLRIAGTVLEYGQDGAESMRRQDVGTAQSGLPSRTANRSEVVVQ